MFLYFYAQFQVLVFSKTLFAQFLHQRAEKQNFGYNDGGFQSSQKKDEYYRMHRKMVALKGNENSCIFL